MNNVMQLRTPHGRKCVYEVSNYKLLKKDSVLQSYWSRRGPILRWILFPNRSSFYEQCNAAMDSTRAQMWLWGKQLQVAQEGFCPTKLLITMKLCKYLASYNAETSPTVHDKLIWKTWHIKTDCLRKNGKILSCYTKLRLTWRAGQTAWPESAERGVTTSGVYVHFSY